MRNKLYDYDRSTIGVLRKHGIGALGHFWTPRFWTTLTVWTASKRAILSGEVRHRKESIGKVAYMHRREFFETHSFVSKIPDYIMIVYENKSDSKRPRALVREHNG